MQDLPSTFVLISGVLDLRIRDLSSTRPRLIRTLLPAHGTPTSRHAARPVRSLCRRPFPLIPRTIAGHLVEGIKLPLVVATGEHGPHRLDAWA